MHVQLLPYTSKQRVFLSTLRRDACVQRLHDRVREPNFPWGNLWKKLGWMPLAMAQDAWILRRIEGAWFKIMYWPHDDPYHRWYGSGELRNQGEHTLILWQYGLDWSSRLNWYFFLGLIPCLAAASLFAVGMAIVSGEITIWILLPVVGLLIMMFIWASRRYHRVNAMARAGEEQLLILLQQLLDAEEVSPLQH
jgi:hypothetical protein